MLTQKLRATSLHAFAIKLSRVSNDANGLVLFKRHGRWGPVCGTHFDNNDASKYTALFLSSSLHRDLFYKHRVVSAHSLVYTKTLGSWGEGDTTLYGTLSAREWVFLKGDLK